MKLVAALAWYDEPLPFLDRLVRSLGGHVDHLVALDGAWAGFPSPKASSARAQRDVIRATAAEVDLPITISVPPRVWPSQIAKRRKLFSLAIKQETADWVLIVDGDFEIIKCDDSALRQSLDLTGLDVAEVMIRNLNRPWPHAELGTMEGPARMIWRGHPDLTVEKTHYGIRIGSRWLHGDRSHVTVEPALDLSKVVVIEHDNLNRPDERRTAAREYRRIRREQELETWR